MFLCCMVDDPTSVCPALPPPTRSTAWWWWIYTYALKRLSAYARALKSEK